MSPSSISLRSLSAATASKSSLRRRATRPLEKLKLNPDVLVLDLMLPGGASGFDILRILRERPQKSPPVIVVTALSPSKEVQGVQTDPNVVLFLPSPSIRTAPGGPAQVLNTPLALSAGNLRERVKTRVRLTRGRLRGA